MGQSGNGARRALAWNPSSPDQRPMEEPSERRTKAITGPSFGVSHLSTVMLGQKPLEKLKM